MRLQAFCGRTLRSARLVGALLAALGLSGCVSWDELTSRDFQFKSLYSGPPDPLVVLRDSKDGDQRARALRALREPKQHGGSDAEQDLVVTILVTAAKTDPQPYCRLAAIQSLGHFHDPRAAQGLADAFFAVTAGDAHKNEPLRTESFITNTSFPPETANIIQCEALTALGRTRNPTAVELLARVARPGPSTIVEESEQVKQQNRDLRIAAVRALGNFSHYQATEALVAVLQKDRDVALHDRALTSLRNSTGKDLPDDPKAWDALVHQAAPDPKGGSEKKFDLVGWFKGE